MSLGGGGGYLCCKVVWHFFWGEGGGCSDTATGLKLNKATSWKLIFLRGGGGGL